MSAVFELLEAKYAAYNRPEFIENDPISIPHLFSKKQDIEISGFFAAVLAWGQRTAIIKKCKELMQRMDNAPYQFVCEHQDQDLKKLLGFKHRTFNDTDLLYFVHFLQNHYLHFESLEQAFIPHLPAVRSDYMQHVFHYQESSVNTCFAGQTYFTTAQSLIYFSQYFRSLADFPLRTGKHISSPLRKATCKRLNMFLRWMVRKDDSGVDFGVWNTLEPKALICPCDVHVDRVARKLQLITRKQTDWLTAVELTQKLREFDIQDPVKYDFALFGMGVEGLY